MNPKVLILISLLLFYYNCLAQKDSSKFVVPDSIPENVHEFTRKKVFEMDQYKKENKIIASYHVLNNKIYKIELSPLNQVVYYDSENAKYFN